MIDKIQDDRYLLRRKRLISRSTHFMRLSRISMRVETRTVIVLWIDIKLYVPAIWAGNLRYI